MGQSLRDIRRRWPTDGGTRLEGSDRIKDRLPIDQELRTEFPDQVLGKLIQGNPGLGGLSSKLADEIVGRSEGNIPAYQLIRKIGG